MGESLSSARRLEEATDELISLLRVTATAELSTWLTSLWFAAGANLKKFGLSSPFRQTFYLLGLAMTTPEPEQPIPLDDSRVESIVALLNEITDSYAHMHTENLFAGKVEPGKVFVAGQAFLHYFMEGRTAVTEQISERIQELCVPYDDVLLERFKIGAKDCLDIAQWLGEEIVHRATDAAEAMKVQKAMLRQVGASRGTAPSADIAERLKSVEFSRERAIIEKGMGYLSRPNSIPIATLASEFGQDKAQAFLTAFALSRGSVPATLRYFASVDPVNPAEKAPLIRDGDMLYVPMHAALYCSMYDKLGDALQNDPRTADRFLKRRGEYLERKTNALLDRLLPGAAMHLTTYYEGPDAQNQHDGMLLYGRALVVVEAKSADVRTPSRDPERSFRNLSQQFKSKKGIQHAYEQARTVVDAIESSKSPVPYYDEQGNEICRVASSDIDASYVVCTTLERFGSLSVDLTHLLQRRGSEPYPWVVNLYDLEWIADAFEDRHLCGVPFLRFLYERQAGHGHLVSDDELNIVGKFIFDGHLPVPRQDEFIIVNDYADLFDDLYFKKHGIRRNSFVNAVPGGANIDLRASLGSDEPVWVNEPRIGKRHPVLGRKIGRNDKCPCGSNTKYKKCCGAS